MENLFLNASAQADQFLKNPYQDQNTWYLISNLLSECAGIAAAILGFIFMVQILIFVFTKNPALKAKKHASLKIIGVTFLFLVAAIIYSKTEMSSNMRIIIGIIILVSMMIFLRKAKKGLLF